MAEKKKTEGMERIQNDGEIREEVLQRQKRSQETAQGKQHPAGDDTHQHRLHNVHTYKEITQIQNQSHRRHEWKEGRGQSHQGRAEMSRKGITRTHTHKGTHRDTPSRPRKQTVKENKHSRKDLQPIKLVLTFN